MGANIQAEEVIIEANVTGKFTIRLDANGKDDLYFKKTGQEENDGIIVASANPADEDNLFIINSNGTISPSNNKELVWG